MQDTENSRLIGLTREDAKDSPFETTELNIEIACGYALRMARTHKKRCPKWMDLDLFDQEVLMAVMKAASSYEPRNRKRATFFTWSYEKVNGAIMEEDRRQRRKFSFDVSMDTGTNFDGLSSSVSRFANDPDEIRNASMSNRISSPFSHAKDIEEKDFIRYILRDIGSKAKLTERELLVVKMIFVDDIKQKDVAKHMKISEGRAHQLKTTGLRKLRNFCRVHGIDLGNARRTSQNQGPLGGAGS